MRRDTPTVLGSSVVARALDGELLRARERGNAEPVVVDVGGGTGVWAVPLAARGCRVTVVEPNPNALAALQRRAGEENVLERITVVANDSDALGEEIAPGSADLVLAHGVLEVVDDPRATMAAVAGAVSVNGAVSVLVSNKYGAVLHRALAGKFDEARRLHDDPGGVLRDDGEALLRRFDAEGLCGLYREAGLEVSLLQGEGVASDPVHETGDAEHAEFELAAAHSPPLRDIASRLHVIGARTDHGA